MSFNWIEDGCRIYLSEVQSAAFEPLLQKTEREHAGPRTSHHVGSFMFLRRAPLA